LAALALWVGANRPWRARPADGQAVNVSTPLPAASVTATIADVVVDAVPDVVPDVVPDTVPDVVADVVPVALPATLTSREVITTTWAVPVQDWPGGQARQVALSADGRWVAFTAAPASVAQSSGPSSTPTQRYDDLYLYDRTQGNLRLITQAPDGAPGNGWTGAPSMTPDGSLVAFYSWAGNLVSGDSNAVQDAFVYDPATQQVTRVSVGLGGSQANDRSGDSSGTFGPALSADGRWVAFHSAASNLVDNDTNGWVDVFLYDRQSATTQRISLGPEGAEANGDASHPALSADGNWVVFQARATNLDPRVPRLESLGVYQIYLHDRRSGTTTLISRGPDGRPGAGDSTQPTISGDGRYVVYTSNAANLVAGDSNRTADILLTDRETGVTRQISVSSAGTQGNRAAMLPSISLDGRYITFVAEASNLVSGDGNGVADLFLHDQQARHTSRVSVAVVGPWSTREANGPSTGPAAIIPGGRLVAFVSAATNLAPATTGGVPGLFLHERRDAPMFTLTGRVVERGGAPVAGVAVAAGAHRTLTDADGRFMLEHLVGGTYTLAAAKPGYSFAPPRRTISLLTDLAAQDFLADVGASPDAAFDLPIAYAGSASTLLWLLRDTDEGGWVDAWFDHDRPTYVKDGALLLWDGRRRTLDPYNLPLGCFERRCYDGHDGIDFPYRDPNPATPNIFEPVTIWPAAAGRLAAVVQECSAGDRWCNRGYGNEAILYHDNGLFTRYSHLATLAPGVNLAAGAPWLTPELPLGEMGSTGNSFGTHLHFAVHRDNGNGRWDGEGTDLPLDPFGWAGAEPDPWVVRDGGPVSRWLWRFNPTTEAILLGSEGATLRDSDGAVTVQIPPGALAGQVRVELMTGAAVAAPRGPLRSLGRGFRLQLLDWLQGGSALSPTLARPVELSAGYAGATTRHLDMSRLLLYRMQPGSGWVALPTVVDSEAQAVLAAADQLGDFDLQAPLLCPSDGLEPDDTFDAAVFVPQAGATFDRLFDVDEDEDWFQVEVGAGVPIRVVVQTVAPGTALTATIYDLDGLTPLTGRSGPGELMLTTVVAGRYFVRVAPTAENNAGCDADYRISVRGG
jgi:Tol biopolymer transport system component